MVLFEHEPVEIGWSLRRFCGLVALRLAVSLYDQDNFQACQEIANYLIDHYNAKQ